MKKTRTKNRRKSHFPHPTSPKGITLIALIITIIVMLILVGVTINVAMNGGLMEKASRAKEDQQKASETEQLQDYILGKMDNNLKIPANLETIKIGDTTYNVTAEEGEEGAIAIKLTKPGEQAPTRTYDLESDIKIKGVKLQADIADNKVYRIDTSEDIEIIAINRERQQILWWIFKSINPYVLDSKEGFSAINYTLEYKDNCRGDVEQLLNHWGMTWDDVPDTVYHCISRYHFLRNR